MRSFRRIRNNGKRKSTARLAFATVQRLLLLVLLAVSLPACQQGTSSGASRSVSEPDPVTTTVSEPPEEVWPLPEFAARGLYNNTKPEGPWTVPDTPRSRMPNLTYVGGVRIDDQRFGASSVKSSKGGFSVVDGNIWITGNRNEGRSVGAFAMPEPSPSEDPSDWPVAQNVVPFFKVVSRPCK